jgi:hypothetical protein
MTGWKRAECCSKKDYISISIGDTKNGKGRRNLALQELILGNMPNEKNLNALLNP